MRKIAITMIIALLTGIGSATACDMAGNNKHIGSVVAINADARTFTILDMATNKKIRFQTARELLSAIEMSDEVKITYRETDQGRLETLAIEYI